VPSVLLGILLVGLGLLLLQASNLELGASSHRGLARPGRSRANHVAVAVSVAVKGWQVIYRLRNRAKRQNLDHVFVLVW
jgi:hypothetical protein